MLTLRSARLVSQMPDEWTLWVMVLLLLWFVSCVLPAWQVKMVHCASAHFVWLVRHRRHRLHSNPPQRYRRHHLHRAQESHTMNDCYSASRDTTG